LASIKSLRTKGRNTRLESSAQIPSGNLRDTRTRRAFLAIAAGAGLGVWARKLGAGRGESAPLRPPGAVAEDNFTGSCVRCNSCVRVCPSKIIHPDTGLAGIAGLLAPTVRYNTTYCLKECNACTQTCPSGALQASNLEQKNRYVIGEALVDGEICWLTLGKKECDACMRACPYDAVRIHWDENQYVAYPVIDQKKCNGCGACEVVCPTGEVKAIRVWKSARLFL
jgi:ferredoxin-type protein NapF